MDQNGVNYYKGVLLCSRPNESPSVNKEKPFCGRVYNHETIGLVPTKRYDQRHVQKRVLPVLSNHKKWLESFKKKVKEQKEQQEKQREKQVEKLEKIKKQGAIQRENLKKSMVTGQALGQQKAVKEQQKPSMKKPKTINNKPLWAQTEKQVEQNEQAQVDDVLDFFQKGQLKDYLADQQVNRVVQDLRKRIQILKNEGEDWKKKQANRIRQARQNDEQNAGRTKQDKDDILSRISKQSGSQSVASQKTAERVQQLQKKKQQKDWDKYTSTSKKSMANIDEQIAKNVADQVLRNYPALKHHSNQSVRKLIQQQARQVMKQQKAQTK